MKNHKDIQVDKKSHTISLCKLTDKKVVDVEGYLTSEFGSIVFQVTHIILDDGTSLYLGGEHDIAFIEDNIPNNTEEDLERLHNEANE